MKSLRRLSLLPCLALLLLSLRPCDGLAQRSRKAVFIIVDGIPADVIEKLDLPVLKSIAGKNGYSRAFVGGRKGTYSETPTISAVGYNSVLTGTWVNKHNVWDNDIAEPNYHYPTIFRYLKEQYPEKTTAIFSTWLDNRTKLVGDSIPQTGNIPVSYHYDGMELDTVRFFHDSARRYLDNIDDSVSSHAAGYIRSNAPDLSWVYLEYTDDMGHAHGDSPQFTDAIREADKRIGRIWDAIQYRTKQFNEDWLLIITTDHGRDAKTGRGHGGQSDRERSGWIVTNAGKLNAQFRAPQLSIVDIMPTIARFLNIDVPRANAYEIDGISFIDSISFMQPTITAGTGAVNVTWKPVTVQQNDSLKIWISDTNQFSEGGKDEYRLIKTVPLKAGKATIPNAAGFHKIVLEAPKNMANGWIGK